MPVTRPTLFLCVLLVSASLTLTERALSRAITPTVDRSVYLPLVTCLGCVGTGLPKPTDPAYASAMRQRAVEIILAARIAAGCPAEATLAVPALMQAAQDWSTYSDQLGAFEHSVDWYQRYGYAWGATENIGVAYSAEHIVQYWMASPAHQYNLLKCGYRDPNDPSYSADIYYHIGVGYQDGYWTYAIATVFP